MRVFGKLSFFILITFFAFFVNKEVQGDPNKNDVNKEQQVTTENSGNSEVNSEDQVITEDEEVNSEEQVITEDEEVTGKKTEVSNGSSNANQHIDPEAEKAVLFFYSYIDTYFLITSTTIAEIDFHQKLDHFNTEDKTTWTQRAYVDRHHERNGSKIAVLEVGKLKQIHDNNLENPIMHYLGEKLHAPLYVLEHRYYGTSVPTNVSTENLEKYNNTKQVLADIENFIQSSVDNDKKWIVVGTGIGGTLATLFRSMYPDIASSALIFGAPLQILTETKQKNDLLKSIRDDIKPIFLNAFNKLNEFIRDGKYDELQKKFKMCTKLNEGNLNDNVKYMYWTLLNDLATILDTEDIFMILTNSSTDELDKLGFIISLNYKNNCFSVDYNDAMNKYKNVDIMYEDQIDYPKSISTVLGTRPYFYQHCNEYGFFETFDDDIFESHLPEINIDLGFYCGLCKQAFDINEFDTSRFNELIDTTNTTYRGRNIQATNVISVVPDTKFWQDIGLAANEKNEIIKINFGVLKKSYLKEKYELVFEKLREWTSD